jgi:molybdopterin/thiamine biosynthesis adenylyltransferase
MSRLVLTAERLLRIRQSLLGSKQETCAVLLGRAVEVDGHLARIVVRETLNVPDDAYLERSAIRALLRPEFVAEVATRISEPGEGLVFVHSHPFELNDFSAIDDEGEKPLVDFLTRRHPASRSAALLVTPTGVRARELGTERGLRVIAPGPESIWTEISTQESLDLRHDRQIRAFGNSGQRRLEEIRVGIVGLGGTGSVVCEQLAHLGIQDFLLVDPDQVEESNLNRLVGATSSDLGVSKVAVAERMIQRIRPSSRVSIRIDSVLKAKVARDLADVDFLFCCTDSHGSRAVLNQFAYQYLVPTIDMGVAITVEKGAVTNIVGRTQLLTPGLACLTCANLLNPEQVRRDLLTDFQRQADPYIIGDAEPAPAVISINSTMASLAVTMFLSVVTGIPSTARMLNYNAITGVVRPAICTPHPSCIVCSSRGALARGDEWPLPARQE